MKYENALALYDIENFMQQLKILGEATKKDLKKILKCSAKQLEHILNLLTYKYQIYESDDDKTIGVLTIYK